jgi:tryptophanyl-tRNA synthetase
VDQDPYFRLTRDVAGQLGYAKPSLIHARFLDALQGPGSKMSASDESSSILVRDTPEQISSKIRRYAFSGGGATLEEHRENGGDPEVDVCYQYLRFFMEVGGCHGWVGYAVYFTDLGRRMTRSWSGSEMSTLPAG